jgi:hypothetical protein
MEKTRLIPYALRACRWYLIVFHILFVIWIALAFFSVFFDGTSMKDYCIYAEPGEPYDFVWGESTLCRIDWGPLLQEIFLVGLIIYLVFLGPVWLAKFLLGRVKSGLPR